LSFSYDITPIEVLDRIAELEKQIKVLEAEGWAYDFNRTTYKAFCVSVKKFRNGKICYQGCNNDYFNTIEEANEYIANAPTVEGEMTYQYKAVSTIRYKDVHRNYNTITGEEYITEVKY
jgi:hypothetical protein